MFFAAIFPIRFSFLNKCTLIEVQVHLHKQVGGINIFKTKKWKRSAEEPRVFLTTQAQTTVPADIVLP